MTVHGFQTFEIKIHKDIYSHLLGQNSKFSHRSLIHLLLLLLISVAWEASALLLKKEGVTLRVDFKTCSPNIVGIGFNSRNRFIRDKPERKYLFSK